MADALAPRRDGRADLERALAGLADAHAPATVRAYRSAWDDWLAYAAETGLPGTIPVESGYLLAWLSACEGRGLSMSSLRRRVGAMRAAHRFLGQRSPTDDPKVGLFLKAASRRAAERGRVRTPKRAVTGEILKRMLGTLRGSRAVRNRAILLVGYVSGCRRGELAALEWRDVTREGDGIVLLIRRSKTDQEGVGRRAGLPRGEDPELCPVRALEALWASAGSADLLAPPDARVFRCSAETIANVVKRACARAGLDPADFAAHSLRRGMITEARRAGVHNAHIMHQSGHRSEAMLADYTQAVDAAENPAARAVVTGLQEKKEESCDE